MRRKSLPEPPPFYGGGLKWKEAANGGGDGAGDSALSFRPRKFFFGWAIHPASGEREGTHSRNMFISVNNIIHAYPSNTLNMICMRVHRNTEN